MFSGERLHGFLILLSNSTGPIPGDAKTCHSYKGAMSTGATETLLCDTMPTVGQHVIIKIEAYVETLTLCEVLVHGTPVVSASKYMYMKMYCFLPAHGGQSRDLL